MDTNTGQSYYRKIVCSHYLCRMVMITVVICTYNHDDLLAISLKSLSCQSLSPEHFRVLVVDNAGLESTRQVADHYEADYVWEKNVGHSHARNRGCSEADSPWILFLDDDIKAPANLLEQFYRRFKVADYAALGGAVRPWFRVPPPPWLLKYFGHTKYPSSIDDLGPLRQGQYLIGCLMAVRKSSWQAIGGFSDAVGMKGEMVGRADDDEFQHRLREAGYMVYYDPEIAIDHLIRPYKYRIRGLLKLAYASGRDGVGLPGNPILGISGFLQQMAIILFYSIPFNIARLLFKRGYFWQNAVVDSLTKIWLAWGQFYPHRRKA